MGKLDLKKEFKALFNPPKKEAIVVHVPEFQYLMIEGIGADVESERFQNAIQALFSVSYKTKFNIKKTGKSDYAVMPLQGQWWADNMDDFINANKEMWRWNLMILQPDFVTNSDIEQSKNDFKDKISEELVTSLKLKKIIEGRSATIMHIGPYSEEHENIMKMHQLIKEQGGTLDGHKNRHHEIYIGDFRRTAPEKLRTVLRQPF